MVASALLEVIKTLCVCIVRIKDKRATVILAQSRKNGCAPIAGAQPDRDVRTARNVLADARRFAGKIPALCA